ncbi:hypothetical protein I6N90_19985 [Paenibacillus sp. GSMTC-2017]|uniref:hypothetical protein n=1 Tax=Paenibacillus sp. GSMTC-2017 TaxID=2794350 RepID=UPI0018D89FE1|nr:hypothetical protein [Paenibacillus sp. GSMTC-2017]MBH5320087.1 hypothetical protein [Paenibacillus sp. GSMTC-2017]
MQRTIYDFLYRKYELQMDSSQRTMFEGSLKVYWGIKMLMVTAYIVYFLVAIGEDQFLPNETYWIVIGMVASMVVVTLAYMNVVTAWFSIMLGRHRKWIDNLLIIAGILLCLKIPTYTLGQDGFEFGSIQESLLYPGIFLFVAGLYRKLHYRSAKVVQLCAAVSVLLSAAILSTFSLDTIGGSLYLGFILLINVGFTADLLFYYYWQTKSKKMLSYTG